MGQWDIEQHAFPKENALFSKLDYAALLRWTDFTFYPKQV
jgi:hypothetical protein